MLTTTAINAYLKFMIVILSKFGRKRFPSIGVLDACCDSHREKGYLSEYFLRFS